MTVKEQTQAHIDTVGRFLDTVMLHLISRKDLHDRSKLESPEAEIFEVMTAKLKGSTYGSPEYAAMLAEMKPALDHHYANNRHHPEHYKDGVQDMNLVDLLEMFCDWKAATLRHANGDIMQSIDINQKRFKYSDDLKRIFQNTAELLK